MKGIRSCWIDARALLQHYNVTAVTLPGIDEGRTLGGSPNSSQIFSNLTGFVTGIIAYVQAGKRGRTDPAESGENEVFQFYKLAEAVESIKGETILGVKLKSF
jgi:hypothetical protein